MLLFKYRIALTTGPNQANSSSTFIHKFEDLFISPIPNLLITHHISESDYLLSEYAKIPFKIVRYVL